MWLLYSLDSFVFNFHYSQAYKYSMKALQKICPGLPMKVNSYAKAINELIHTFRSINARLCFYNTSLSAICAQYRKIE